ncbi:MAG TPA: hypothetical protein VGN34_18040 [Ktedonobacteraceae bacterium]
MREQAIQYGCNDLSTGIHDVAVKAIEMYAQGLLTVEVLSEQMTRDWVRLYGREVMPTHDVLVRLAQRVCSRELCQAWQSSDSRRCELAYGNLQGHLRRSLLRTRYGPLLQGYICATEDVVNSTLEILCTEAARKGSDGPDDPAAFLKWTQTIVIRQARLYVQRYQRDTCLSLDEQSELFAENIVDTREGDPLHQLLVQELRQILAQAIMGMNNKRYQQVLLYSYLAEIDEHELAKQLRVPVTDIYLWRHRALKMLRNKPEVRALRTLLH